MTQNAELNEINRFNLAESYPGALLVYEAHGEETILFANKALIELFECEDLADFMEYTHASFKNIVHPEDLERVEASIWKQIHDQQTLPDAGVKYLDDFVDYRIITKAGHVLQVEDTGRLVSHNKYGEIFYVFITDRDARKHHMDFQRFLENAEYDSTDTSAPDYQAYIIWNLSRNDSYLKQSGIGYIPEDQKDSYTYDVHHKQLTSFMGSEISVKEAELYTREKLLDAFEKGEEIKPLIVNYNVRGNWSRIQSEFGMMRDPHTGDVYLKVQNRNAVKRDLYENVFEATVKDVFESVLYLNFDEDALLVIDNLAGENARRSQQIISKCLTEIGHRVGLPCASSQELEQQIIEREKEKSTRSWTFSTPEGFYYHVTLRRTDRGESAFAFGIVDATTDVTAQMERDREDYRNKTMLSALAVEYVTIVEVDIPTGTVTAFKTHSASLPEVDEAMKTGDYAYVQQVMVKTSVDDRDQNKFNKITSLEYIKKRLQEVQNYSFVYKASFDLYIELKVVRADDTMEGEPKHVLMAFADKDQVTREKLASEHDELTGLQNRRVYEKTLGKLKKEKHQSLCMIGMDLNGLKYANDNFGHLAGDELLKGAADCIRSVFGQIAGIYRIGGDEFEAILVDQDYTKDELRRMIKQECKKWKGEFSDELTMSVGIAETSGSNQKTIGELIEEADTDMYADKRYYYTQKGISRIGAETNITKTELANRIFELKTMFDEVRMVDVEKHQTVHYDADGTEHREALHCFEIWGKT